jgi:hypothetical protein
MQFTISASGKPAEIRTQLQQQTQAARRDDSDSATITGAISDYIARTLDGVGADETISISGSVSLTVSGSEATMKAIADRKTARQSNPLAPAPQLPSPQADVTAPEGARSIERPDVVAAESALSIPPAKGTTANPPARRASDQSTAQTPGPSTQTGGPNS